MKSALGAASAALLLAGAANALPPRTGGGDTGGNTGGSTTPDAPVRGPAPTAGSLSAATGPYAVQTRDVSAGVSGFGGGTIHYPTNAGNNMGAIAVVPGFVSPESSIEWWGPKLASWGFVVITIDTNSPFDGPPSRARQLSAALDYLIAQSRSSASPISGLVDPDRLGAIGWSMGGGGALNLALDRDIDAIIPTAAYNGSVRPFSGVRTPTLLLSCQNDNVAPNSEHTNPFYDIIPNTTAKMNVEIARQGHYCVTTGSGYEPLLGQLGISWMKAHVDGDTRFRPFLCATNYAGRSDVSQQRNNCRF